MKNKLEFAACHSPLGLYPVVDSASWVALLLSQGVKTIQLRIKNQVMPVICQQIRDSVRLARLYDAQLFINDYWQLALTYKAYGVHLGQDDLDDADLTMIAKAGLRLGVSTHSEAEIKRAQACNPSYLAFGPIYHTDSKVMPFAPQGLDALRYWRQRITQPLVAIGGMTLARIPSVLSCGADSVALISAITKSAQPTLRIKQLLKVVNDA